MSVPEAPFDGEEHARKEGAWVVSYSKLALNSFVELVRSYYTGCKHYYDEIGKLLAGMISDTEVDDIPYVRENKSWVPLEDYLDGGGGNEPVDLEIVNHDGSLVLDLIPAKHTYIIPRAGYSNQDRYGLQLRLPPLSLRVAVISVGDRWWTDPLTGQLGSKIELLPPPPADGVAQYIFTGQGQTPVAILPMRGTYHMVAIDSAWHITDAAAPPEDPEQPS